MNPNNFNPQQFQQQQMQPNIDNQQSKYPQNQVSDGSQQSGQNYPNTNNNQAFPNINPNQMNMGLNPQAQMGMGQFTPGQMGMGLNPQAQMGMGQFSSGQVGMGLNPQAQMGMGQFTPGQMGMGLNPQAQMGMGQFSSGQMGMGLNPQAQMGMGLNPQAQMGMGQFSSGQMSQFPPGPIGMGSITPMSNLASRTATQTSTTTKEKELQKKLNDLEEELKEKEDEYKEKISKEKKSSQQTIDGLKRKIQELEDEIYDLKKYIQQLQLENNNKQQIIDKISREKTQIEQQKNDLQDDFDGLRNQTQQLIRKSVVSPTVGAAQQYDQQQLQEYENQIKKAKEENKKLKEEHNKQKLVQEDELNSVQRELDKQVKQVDKEHQYFMEARDEITKLQKVILQKDDKIKQLEIQQMNGLDTLRQVNMDKQRMEDHIKQKDLEIETINEQIKILKNELKFLKDLIQDSQNGKQIKLDQNKQYQEFESQMAWLNDKKQEDEKKMKQEIQQNELSRKEKLEKEKKKKEEMQKQAEIKKGNLLVKGNQQMLQAKKEYGQLDVCFIVDVTGSMDSYKEQTKRSVQGSLKIIKQATNRDTNWASVCYQDKAELKKLGKYYEFPFSKDQQGLEKWFDGISCSGGGDSAEDIRGAIKQVCKLSWPSKFRIAIIICDAPCHGRKYNGGCGDDYPDEDIQDAIEELIEKNIVLIALNFTRYTTVMYDQIKKIYESKKKQELFLYQDLQKMDQNQMAQTMTKYIGEASQNATQTNKNQTKSKQGAVQQEIPREKEGAMEALCKQGNFYKFEEQPNVKTVKTKFEVWRVEIKDEEFNKNVDTIEKIQCPQDFSKFNEGTWNCLRTEKPFAFGMMKDVFLMKKLNVNSDELYVIKTPIGSQPYKTMNDALKECKSHLICQKLMKKFVAELQEQATEKEKNIKIPPVIYSDFLILEESQNSFWIAERFFKGEFVKYNNNYGFINEEYQVELNKFAQSFTYYTYFISNFNYMVSDVQGVGNYFTDPAINTHKGNFDETDMGEEGQMMYLVNYENKKALLTYDYLGLLGIYE